MSQLIDVTEEVKGELVQPKGVIRAERKGTNTLILARLDSAVRRFDGKTARYRVEHRWHSSESADVHSVQGNDFTYWQKKEIGQALNGAPLFDCFRLVG